MKLSKLIEDLQYVKEYYPDDIDVLFEDALSKNEVFYIVEQPVSEDGNSMEVVLRTYPY